MLSNIVLLILKVTSLASFVFFRPSYLLSAKARTENTWVNWTFSMANYW